MGDEMSEKLSPEVREALEADLIFELDQRISAAKKRAHQINTKHLASWLVERLELSNWVVRRGEPLRGHSIDCGLTMIPVLNERPVGTEDPFNPRRGQGAVETAPNEAQERPDGLPGFRG